MSEALPKRKSRKPKPAPTVEPTVEPTVAHPQPIVEPWEARFPNWRDIPDFNLESAIAREAVDAHIAANKAMVEVVVLPPGVRRHPFDGGYIEGKTGKRWSPPEQQDGRDYTTRRLEQRAAFEQAERDEEAARNAGCEPGTYRDLNHVLRYSGGANKGRVVPIRPATLGPQDVPTQTSPPSTLLPPHPEQVAAGQDPNAVSDEVAEIMKLRAKEPVQAPATVALIQTSESPDRPIPEVMPDPIRSLAELLSTPIR